MTELSIPQVAQNSIPQNPRTVVDANAIPHELRQYKQFVGWSYEDSGKAKPNKVLKNCRTGGNAGSTWPNTWTDFYTAVATYKSHPHLAGVGFVLTPNDPYVMGDLDDCIIDGKFSTLAIDVMNAIETYFERSPSGHGLRFLVHCRHQPDAIKRPEIELYSTGRFATLTGDVVMNAPIAKVDSMDWFIDRFVPKQEPTATATHNFFSCNDRLLPSGDDAALWSYIFRVNRLAEPIYNGDLSNVRTRKDGTPDDSHAVILLLNSLAYWTKGDASRMERMIRQTYLDKSKWDENRRGWTWLYGRIQDAINFTQRGR